MSDGLPSSKSGQDSNPAAGPAVSQSQDGGNAATPATGASKQTAKGGVTSASNAASTVSNSADASKPASNGDNAGTPSVAIAAPSVNVEPPKPQHQQQSQYPPYTLQQQQRPPPSNGGYRGPGASLGAGVMNGNGGPSSASGTSTSGPSASATIAHLPSRSPQPGHNNLNSGTSVGAGVRSPIVRPPSIDQQLAASFPPPGQSSNNGGNAARDRAASTSTSTASNNTSSNPIAAGFLGAGQRGVTPAATSINAPAPSSSSSNLQSRTGSSAAPLFPPASIVSRTSGQQFPPTSSASAPTSSSSGPGNARTASPYGPGGSASPKPASAPTNPNARQQAHPSHFSRFQYPHSASSASSGSPANRTASPSGGGAANGSAPAAAGASNPSNAPARDPRTPNPVTERLMSNSPVSAAATAPGSGPAGTSNANSASAATTNSATGAGTSAQQQQQQQKDQSRTGGVASSLGPGFMERNTNNGPTQGQAAWRSLLERPSSGASSAQQQAEQAQKRRTNSTSATSSPFAGYSSGFGLPNKAGAVNSAGGGGSTSTTAPNSLSQPPPRSVTASPSAPPSSAQRSPNHLSRSGGYPLSFGERMQQQQQQSKDSPSSSSRLGSQVSPPLPSQPTNTRLPAYFNAPAPVPKPKSTSPPLPGSASTPTTAGSTAGATAGPGQAQGAGPGSPPRRANPFQYGFAAQQQQQRMSGAADAGRASPSSHQQHGHAAHQHSASASGGMPGSAGLHQGQGSIPSQTAQQQAHYRRISMGGAPASHQQQQSQNSMSAMQGNLQSGLFRPPHAGHSRTGSLTSAQAIGQSLQNSAQGSPSTASTPVSRTGNSGIALASQTDQAAAANAAWRAIPTFQAQHQAAREAQQNREAQQARMEAQKKSEMSPRLQQGQTHQQEPTQSQLASQSRLAGQTAQEQQAAYEIQQASHKRKRSDMPESTPASAVPLNSATYPQHQQQTITHAQAQAQVRGQQGIPHPQQQAAHAPAPAVTLQSHRGTKGSLFSAEDIKGAALRPPLMAVRSDLVVRALHKIASQQSTDPSIAPVPPFLGRVIYDPFLDPADLLDAELLRQGVGGKVEIWLDTEWLQGEIWEAGAPSHPATSVPPSPDLSETPPSESTAPNGAEKGKGREIEDVPEEPMMDIDGHPLLQQRRPTKQPEDASPNWTLWDLLPLRNRKIWGTDVYTDDSDILAACIHSGWLRLGSTAPLFGAPQAESLHKRKKRRKTLKHRSLRITIVIAPKLIKYEGSLRAGVRSRSWGNSHDGVSYAIESVELVENAVHRLPHSRLKRNVSTFLPLAKERCACSAGCDQSHRPPAYNRSIAIGKALIKA